MEYRVEQGSGYQGARQRHLRLLEKAADMMARHRLSFRDPLIVQAAVDGGAATLCSEDLAHGRSIRGATVENPFL